MNPKTTGILFAVAAALAAFVYFYEIGGEAERKEAEEAEKRLFTGVEQDAIESISLRTEDGVPVVLERVDDRWRITAPIDFGADQFAADGIASALVQLVSETVIEEPRTPDVYGLEPDETVVRFSVGDEEHVLHIGDKTPVGANQYASVDGVDAVYTVAAFRVQSLRKEFEALRDKRIAHFDRASVRKLTASWPEGRVVVERGDEGWQLVSPIQGRADDATVDDLLSDLSFLRAEGFEDDPHAAFTGTFAFAAAVELASETADADEDADELEADAGEGASSAAARVVRLAIGPPLEDGAMRLVQGAEHSLYKIPASTLDDFPLHLDDYRYRQLAKFPAADAVRVVLGFASPAGESVAITAVREDGAWTSSPDPIAPGEVASLVTALSNLRAERILADDMGVDELRGVGLDPPGAVIAVFDAAGDEGDAAAPLAEVHLGESRSSGVVARLPDGDTVFELDPAVAEHLPVSLDAFRNRFVAKEPGPETEPTVSDPVVPEPATEGDAS